MTHKQLRYSRAQLAMFLGINLHKSYFSKSANELALIEDLRQVCGFRGNNNLGRPRAYQFYLYLQNALEY